MDLEKQVCSLELAKRLKALEIPQDSLFYWYYRDTFQVFHADYVPDGWGEECAAFTVAELGEMLPATIPRKGLAKVDHCILASAKNTFDGDSLLSYMYEFTDDWDDMDPEYEHWVKADTEANARAKMLIYLKENNLI